MQAETGLERPCRSPIRMAFVWCNWPSLRREKQGNDTILFVYLKDCPGFLRKPCWREQGRSGETRWYVRKVEMTVFDDGLNAGPVN